VTGRLRALPRLLCTLAEDFGDRLARRRMQFGARAGCTSHCPPPLPWTLWRTHGGLLRPSWKRDAPVGERLASEIRIPCRARKHDSGPWGGSGGDVVLVSESAEDLLPVNPELDEVHLFGRVDVGLSWGELAEGTVRPGGVVVDRVFGSPVAGGAR
jgi:hypothetical protein